MFGYFSPAHGYSLQVSFLGFFAIVAGTNDALKLLAETGYRWYGDVFDVDLPRVINHGNSRIVAIPLSYDVNDMPSMKYGHPPRVMLESYDEVIEIARAGSELRLVDVTSHAHIFGHHRGAYFYEKIVERAMASPDIWVATRAEIADHVLSVMPA